MRVPACGQGLVGFALPTHATQLSHQLPGCRTEGKGWGWGLKHSDIKNRVRLYDLSNQLTRPRDLRHVAL